MAYLILEDGSRYEGTLFGACKPVTGEVVFTTGMTGYQETLTDPSYCGQLVCMTYPLIGNVGISDVDMESGGVAMRGFIISELCDLPSNWQMRKSLPTFLEEQGVTGITGIDTRALTKRIRLHGTLRGRIVDGEPTQADFDACKRFEQKNLVQQVTCPAPYTVAGGDVEVAVLDFGLKRHILEGLRVRGCSLKVYPSGTGAEEILAAGCDGVMLTNGPGDPKDNVQDIATIRTLMDKKPTFGICLGHQMMALAQGATCVPMKYGHHGGNHPVKDLERGTCSVTAQNHNYVIDAATLPTNAVVTHVNWNDQSVEGVRYTDKQAFSVQFHPEASAGPRETTYLFDRFVAMVRENKKK